MLLLSWYIAGSTAFGSSVSRKNFAMSFWLSSGSGRAESMFLTPKVFNGKEIDTAVFPTLSLFRPFLQCIIDESIFLSAFLLHEYSLLYS